MGVSVDGAGDCGSCAGAGSPAFAVTGAGAGSAFGRPDDVFFVGVGTFAFSRGTAFGGDDFGNSTVVAGSFVEVLQVSSTTGCGGQVTAQVQVQSGHLVLTTVVLDAGDQTYCAKNMIAMPASNPSAAASIILARALLSAYEWVT